MRWGGKYRGERVGPNHSVECHWVVPGFSKADLHYSLCTLTIQPLKCPSAKTPALETLLRDNCRCSVCNMQHPVMVEESVSNDFISVHRHFTTVNMTEVCSQSWCCAWSESHPHEIQWSFISHDTDSYIRLRRSFRLVKSLSLSFFFPQFFGWGTTE